jgi:hypothetical protein
MGGTPKPSILYTKMFHSKPAIGVPHGKPQPLSFLTGWSRTGLDYYNLLYLQSIVIYYSIYI